MSDELAADDLRAWSSGLDALFERVAGRFGRVEPRKQARAYVTGLLAPVERKNGWQLAEAAGDAAPAFKDDLRIGDTLVQRSPMLRFDCRSETVNWMVLSDEFLSVETTGSWQWLATS